MAMLILVQSIEKIKMLHVIYRY